MKFKESFSLIVDNHKPDDYRVPVAFMKSFGLKCDCVGWTTITLDGEAKIELIQEMRKKADEQGLKLRCQNYKKEYLGYDADWYYVTPKVSVKNDDWEWDDGRSYVTVKIKGYKISKGTHVFSLPYHIGVSEKFVDVCRQLNLTGVDFTWITDKGRFDAPPYFYVIPEEGFSRGTSGRYDKPEEGTDSRKYPKFLRTCQAIDIDGSHMEQLAEMWDVFRWADLMPLIDKDTAPEKDFAFLGNETLIRREAAETLIAYKVLNWSDLQPAMYLDREKQAEIICPKSTATGFPVHIRERHQAAYEKWLQKSRPVYHPKESDAVRFLRKVKKERSEDFNKALKKAVVETLPGTCYDLLIPYYKVSNGGAINDEIDFLPYEAVEEATAEFLEELHEDGIVLADMPELESAVVFASAANGDAILLNADGSVMRYDHEDPYLSNEWETLAQFFFDEIEVE